MTTLPVGSLRPGDHLSWTTWAGDVTTVIVNNVTADRVSIEHIDGVLDAFEATCYRPLTLPRTARRATADETAAFNATHRPWHPYH